MRHDVDAALDQCLSWLRAGTDMEDCLAHYPEYAGELRPLLDTVTRVGWVITPAPTAAARAAGEKRMLAALARKRERQARSNPLVRFGERLLGPLVLWRTEGPRPAWSMLAVGLAVLLLLSGGVTTVASAHSLPGDLLYPVKLASQRVQLALASEPAKRQLLEDQFSAQQRSDVHAVLKGGRQVTVEFEGRLDQMDGNLWMVGGLPVTIQDSTVIVGQLYLGAMVSVEGGLTGSGLLLATWIGLESAPGPLPTETPEPLPTETPEPTETLQPTPSPEPNEMVEATETPEPTDTPASTETPIPTETPEPASAAASTETPEPPETRQPAATSLPDDSAEVPESPEPAETADLDEPPESDETSAPTEMPEADGTPEPEETQEPDRTAEPDDTPEPAGTDEPDEVPDPAETAEPDETPEHDQTPEPDDDAEPDPSPEPDDTTEPTEEPND